MLTFVFIFQWDYTTAYKKKTFTTWSSICKYKFYMVLDMYEPNFEDEIGLYECPVQSVGVFKKFVSTSWLSPFKVAMIFISFEQIGVRRL